MENWREFVEEQETEEETLEGLQQNPRSGGKWDTLLMKKWGVGDAEEAHELEDAEYKEKAITTKAATAKLQKDLKKDFNMAMRQKCADAGGKWLMGKCWGDRKSLNEDFVENFKSYLREEGEKLQLYCDMDGVLVDFVTGAINAMNELLPKIAADRERLSQLEPDRKNREYVLFKSARKAVEELGGDWNMKFEPQHLDKTKEFKKSLDFMYAVVTHDVDWWANLPWVPGAEAGLWKKILKFNPKILSAPMDNSPESAEGKKIWCQKNLGYSGDQIVLSEDKTVWGSVDGVQGVLIDDRDKYVAQFEDGGGIAIKHDPNNVEATLATLEELGFSQQGGTGEETQ
jgi:hypothetical protein